jgi:hypothetical protein
MKFLQIFKKISEALLPYFFARDKQQFNANLNNIPEYQVLLGPSRIKP